MKKMVNVVKAFEIFVWCFVPLRQRKSREYYEDEENIFLLHFERFSFLNNKLSVKEREEEESLNEGEENDECSESF